MIRFLTVTLLISCLFSCKQEPKDSIETKKDLSGLVLPEWAKGDVIYEVNIRQFTKEGTINAFSDHIPRLKELGVDILWLMPVFPISEAKRKGTLGSYYAVSDFRKVNPEFGTNDDLKNLIDKIHAYKMKVILDWVPNHTGWDHTWIKTKPEYYTKDSTGQITDPLNDKGQSMDWKDVADLNYDNKEMRKAMIADMMYWINENNVDGFRMDVAWGVPNDFWAEVADTLYKTKPDAYMLAEAENPDHMNNDYFHTGYGWTFHHLINDVAKGKKNVNDIITWRDSVRTKLNKGSLMHFITNHDENSWNGTEFERMGTAYKTFQVLTFTFDGIPLIYNGQEEPLTKRLKFFDKDEIVWKEFKDDDFLQKLCILKSSEKAMWTEPYGATAKIIGKTDHTIAYKREMENSKVVVVLNLSDQNRNIKFDEPIKNMKDIFGAHNTSDYEAGREIGLKPWEYRVYINK